MAALTMRATAWRWRGLGVGGRLGPLGDGQFRRRFGWLLQQKGSDHRAAWTPRLSRAFVEALRCEVQEAGGRRFSDRTINRTLAHLKTFATWIHKHRPFPFGNPTEKLKNLIVPVGLEIERALSEEECVHLLEAADFFRSLAAAPAMSVAAKT